MYYNFSKILNFNKSGESEVSISVYHTKEGEPHSSPKWSYLFPRISGERIRWYSLTAQSIDSWWKQKVGYEVIPELVYIFW